VSSPDIRENTYPYSPVCLFTSSDPSMASRS